MEKQSAPTKLYSDVVVIGAGIAGVGVGCQLQRQLGVTSFKIYDREADLGGAWWANKYPGCGVDIPGALYSLSWIPNTNFTSAFPSQSEILRYIRNVADTYKLRPHMAFRTEWKSAKWSEKSQTWSIGLKDLVTGEDFIHEAKILISAVGGVTNPKYPSLPGVDTFEGTIAHTARWNSSYNYKDKDVVVIGNGCSAAQVVPAIVDDVKSVTQFVRSPQYYMPGKNPHIPALVRFLFGWVPFILTIVRWTIFWYLETGLGQFYDDENGLKARKKALKRSQDYMNTSAPEQYRDILMPKYELGCKRRILDMKYIKTLHHKNVLLAKDHVVEVKPKSVVTASGREFQTDFIILATGFEPTQWLIDLVGRDGQTLQKHWKNIGGMEAYKTVALNGFPNLFYVLGPNAGSGHTSVVYAIECSINLIMKIARPVLQGRVKSVEVERTAEVEFAKEVQGALRQTVLTKQCSSYFSDPVTGWNSFSYPFSSLRMWFESRFPQMSHWTYRS